MASISKFIEQKLKLKINREKSKVGRSEEVKFLGMTIVDGTVVISGYVLHEEPCTYTYALFCG
jgi:hypothetical protein